MVRFFVALAIFLQVGFAANFTYPDFRQCYNKNIKSFVYFGDIRAVAITKNLAVAYSKSTPKVPFVKFDPFLNLYLFASKKPLIPVRLKSTHLLKLGEWIAGMDDDSLYAGNFAKSGDLLDTLYLQNAQMSSNSIISCLCCQVYGLGIGNGTFIGSEYIQRFLDAKEIFYGDIGVRFEKNGKDFEVAEIDPFYKNQSLQIGDKISKVNNKNITSLKQLNQAILFAKPKSKINLEFMRANSMQKSSATVVSRVGGGNLSDSFLEQKGIFLDKDLRIIAIEPKSFAAQKGLKVGDKLMYIDKMKLESQKTLRKYLSNTKAKYFQLLFDRHDFQFFVKMPL